jgi:hypothetical protein
MPIKITEKYHNYHDKIITGEIEGASIIEFLPICIGVSADRSKIEIMDSIDEYRSEILSRDQVLALADEFRAIAEIMKP